jgi:hypothetical protein
MSGWLIAITGLIYAWVALEQYWLGHGHMAMVYAGYSFSNVGLYYMAKAG